MSAFDRKEQAFLLGVVAVAGLLGFTAPATRAADEHAHDHGASAHGSAQSGPYAPGLGEIMTLQQMRHAKLWFAGAARNWPLADYELDELKEGFEDAAKLHSVHDGVPVGEMIAKLTPDPLRQLSSAISKKDSAGFARAFDRLTAACNACHQAANRGFIRIGRPTAPPFGNQVFAPR